MILLFNFFYKENKSPIGTTDIQISKIMTFGILRTRCRWTRGRGRNIFFFFLLLKLAWKLELEMYSQFETLSTFELQSRRVYIKYLSYYCESWCSTFIKNLTTPFRVICLRLYFIMNATLQSSKITCFSLLLRFCFFPKYSSTYRAS